MSQLPWHIEKQGEKFCVIKDTDGKSAGCHPSRAEANDQLRALYANEKKMKACSVTLGNRELTVLVADTISERAFGLGGRESLDEAGMLFVRPVSDYGAFHMSDVRFPLRMAFFTGTGELVAQVVRKPGDGPWRPSKPFKYALELTDLTELPEAIRLEL